MQTLRLAPLNIDLTRWLKRAHDEDGAPGRGSIGRTRPSSVSAVGITRAPSVGQSERKGSYRIYGSDSEIRCFILLALYHEERSNWQPDCALRGRWKLQFGEIPDRSRVWAGHRPSLELHFNQLFIHLLEALQMLGIVN